MKYPQLGHKSGDVEHWLEKQLEAQGVYGVICAKYILGLLIEISKERRSNNSIYEDSYENKKCCQTYCSRQSWDIDSLKHLGVVHYPMSAIRESLDVYKIVDELCVKLRKTQENSLTFFDASKNYEKKFILINAPIMYSNATLNGNLISVNKTHSLPSCNSLRTEAKFHDPLLFKDQSKMEDYFSSLFFENPSDNFGYEFTRIKSGERQDGMECDRIKFYNRKNLASECSERLYERNSDIDKLIAKFDSNIEDLWKPSHGSENLNNSNCEHLFSDNIMTNSSLLNGSNFIWSFGQNEKNFFENMKQDESEEKTTNYKSTLSNDKTFKSSDFTASNLDINAMLDSVNFTLAKGQKWSAMDGQNNVCDIPLNHKRFESCFTEVIPKTSKIELNQNTDVIIPKEGNVNYESEDLLTSAKTHFRPIRMEEAQTSQMTEKLPDGESSDVHDDFDKVKFTRSNSGILYLDNDSELEAPRKYMEFKKINLDEIDTQFYDSDSDSSIMEKFVPKFRVRQSNEKFCQTDDLSDDDQIVPSFQETDSESDSQSDVDEFYFPGDSELAENIINNIENDRIILKKIKSDWNYNDIYVIDDSEKNALQIKSTTNQCICDNEKNWASSIGFEVKHDLEEIWCSEIPTDDDFLKGEELTSTDIYFRFREELTQEGEQLLSDLSSLQQLYWSSDLGNEESAKAFDEDVTSENFCSLEFLNKFKDSKNDMCWKNFWIGKNEESLKNSQDVIWDKKTSSEDLKKIEDLQLNEANERFSKMSLDDNKRKNILSQKSCMFHTNHCFSTNKLTFSNCANSQNLVADGSNSNGKSYELAKN